MKSIELGKRWPSNNIIFLCVVLLSINSVLIQTVLVDDVVIKTAVRLAVISMLFFVISVFRNKINVLMLFVLLFQSTLMLVTYNFDHLTLIFLLILLAAVYTMTEREVVKILFFSSILPIILVFSMLLLGVTENSIIEYRNRMTFGIVGMGGVTYLYNLVYGVLVLSLLYMHFYHPRRFFICGVMVLSIATYFYIKTDVRGGYSAVLIFVVASLISPYFVRRKSIVLKNLIGLMPLILLSISYFVAYALRDTEFNILLSHRPMLYYDFFEQLSMVQYLSGLSVKQFDSSSIVDNSYIHILFGGGIIFFIIFLILHYRAVDYLFKERSYWNIAFIISCSSYFFVESLAVRIELMFVIYYWYLVFYYGLKGVCLFSVKEKKIIDDV